MPKKNLLREACRDFERCFILNALQKARRSQTAAARILNLPLSTLKYRRKVLGLNGSRPKTKGSAGAPSFPENGGSLREACSKFERDFLRKALEEVRWDRKRASRSLGLPLSTLKYKLSKLP